MKKLFFIVFIFILNACKTPEKTEDIPPHISTGMVKESLLSTREKLMNAGDLNTKISTKIDNAMSLAEQIDLILIKIEEELSKPNFEKPIIENP